jgi:hypothetical protein
MRRCDGVAVSGIGATSRPSSHARSGLNPPRLNPNVVNALILQTTGSAAMTSARPSDSDAVDVDGVNRRPPGQRAGRRKPSSSRARHAHQCGDRWRPCPATPGYRRGDLVHGHTLAAVGLATTSANATVRVRQLGGEAITAAALTCPRSSQSTTTESFTGSFGAVGLRHGAGVDPGDLKSGTCRAGGAAAVHRHRGADRETRRCPRSSPTPPRRGAWGSAGPHRSYFHRQVPNRISRRHQTLQRQRQHGCRTPTASYGIRQEELDDSPIDRPEQPGGAEVTALSVRHPELDGTVGVGVLSCIAEGRHLLTQIGRLPQHEVTAEWRHRPLRKPNL